MVRSIEFRLLWLLRTNCASGQNTALEIKWLLALVYNLGGSLKCESPELKEGQSPEDRFRSRGEAPNFATAGSASPQDMLDPSSL